MQDLQRLRNAPRRCRSWKVTKRNTWLQVPARLLKYYPRPLCAPSLVKSRMPRPPQPHFLLCQQIFFILVCIHAGNPREPPRVLPLDQSPAGAVITIIIFNFFFVNFVYHFSNFQRSRVVNSDSRENYHDKGGLMQAGRTLFLL